MFHVIRGGMATAGFAGMSPTAGFAAQGISAANAYGEAIPSGIPAAGASRGIARFFEISGAGPVYANGPGSIRYGGERGLEVSKLVDRMVSLASDTRLTPPIDMARHLGEMVGDKPVLYRRVAGRVLRATYDREDELNSQTVGLLFDAIYKHLPTMRIPFAEVFLWRLQGLYAKQNNLSPNQIRIVKKLVEGKPEWAAEVVKQLREEGGPIVGGFRTKIAMALDISLQEPVEVDWLHFEYDETYSRR